MLAHGIGATELQRICQSVKVLFKETCGHVDRVLDSINNKTLKKWT